MSHQIKQNLKKDLWNFVQNNETKKLDFITFVNFTLHILLENESFNIEDVMKTSEKMHDKYYEILKDSESIAIEEDPIKANKNLKEEFINKIEPIIRDVKKCKWK